MKKILFVAMALAIVCCMTACESSSGSKDSSLVGTWAYSWDSDLTVKFESDGDYVVVYVGETIDSGTWSTSDGKVTTKSTGEDEGDTSTYSVSGSTLTVDGETWTKV